MTTTFTHRTMGLRGHSGSRTEQFQVGARVPVLVSNTLPTTGKGLHWLDDSDLGLFSPLPTYQTLRTRKT